MGAVALGGPFFSPSFVGEFDSPSVHFEDRVVDLVPKIMDAAMAKREGAPCQDAAAANKDPGQLI